MFVGADKPISLFQSTLLQEERLYNQPTLDNRSLFQSTLLQEERPENYFRDRCRFKFISIHAPTRGATAKMHNIPYASLQ